ncbi:hypothetical protein KC19_2G209800 [Ceratodon purpureus]|uniref:Protein kinase domain-containing protein n=1 Tax=Ceratodon purpureus TaxID=3225 RepID=A0A8T0IYP8_CERPU|nr:hypothetical protein KC19_2G209800 [Ceratodon purpureus]KAG0588029.1 hypothetical protein KC19_2G209800 [Ceratodon purpureus]
MASTNVEPASAGEITEVEVQEGAAAAVTSGNSDTSTAQTSLAEEQAQLHTYMETMSLITEHGKKLAGGMQADIYPTHYEGRDLVLKVHKTLPNVESSLPRWDDKVFNIFAPHVCSSVGYSKVHDGKDSVAWIMPRHLLDLRKLIDSKRRSSKQRGPFSLYVTAVDLITQLAIGMHNLHKRDIMHRDIRAANLLVTHITSNEKIYAIAIADFDGCKGVIGTGFWRAPEVLEQVQNLRSIHDVVTFTFACDVYSFAVTCYEILTGETPFEGKPWSDYEPVLSGERPKLPDDLPQDMASLINRCWHHNPLVRPKSTEILELLREIIRQNPDLKPIQIRFDLADVLSGEVTSERPPPEELLQSLKLELDILQQQNETEAARLGNECIELYEKYISTFGLVNAWAPDRFWEKLPMSLPLVNKANEFLKSLPDNGTNTVQILKIWSQLIMPLMAVEGLGPMLHAFVRIYSGAFLQFLRSNFKAPVEATLRSMSKQLKDFSNSFWASKFACQVRYARATTMRALRRCFGVSKSSRKSGEVQAQLVSDGLLTGNFKAS